MKARVPRGDRRENNRQKASQEHPQSSGCGGGRKEGTGGGACPALSRSLGAQQGADHHPVGVEAPAIPAVTSEGLRSPIFRSPKLMSGTVCGGPWDGWEEPHVPGGLGECPPACP